MTGQTLILPYLRASPLHIPRRDLVLSAADSISLRITVVESDTPTAQALQTLLADPSVRLMIWREGPSTAWDYGARSTAMPPALLWSGIGVASDAAIGSFDVFIASGALSGFPPRCGWAVQLDWPDGNAALLASGNLHLMQGSQTMARLGDFDSDFDHGDFS